MTQKSEKREDPVPVGDAARSAQIPSSFRLHLMMAWDSWLKSALFALAALLLVAAVGLGVFPKTWTGAASVSAIVLIPLGLMTADWRKRAGMSRVSLAALVGFGLILLAAALYPSILPILEGDAVGPFSLKEANDSVTIPPQKAGPAWWLMEVHGKMPKTDKPFSVSYALKLENSDFKEVVKGDLERSWRRVKVGRRTRGKSLASHELNVHRLTADLGKESTLSLQKLAGRLEAPLEVFLRPEPVMWSYLLAVDLPLILAVGFIDVLDEKRRRTKPMIRRASFMLIFGAVFADNWVPGVWIGPILLGLLVASAGSFMLGYAIPPVFRPIAEKLKPLFHL